MANKTIFKTKKTNKKTMTLFFYMQKPILL